LGYNVSLEILVWLDNLDRLKVASFQSATFIGLNRFALAPLIVAVGNHVERLRRLSADKGRLNARFFVLFNGEAFQRNATRFFQQAQPINDPV